MEIPKEIVDARSFLEKAERENNPERKVYELKQGIDLLECYLEDNPDTPEDIVTLIRNLRRSHTRRLLSQLLSIKEIEIETWLDYVLLLITKLKEELNYVTEQSQELKRNYEEFWNVWSDVLREALKDYI